MASKSPFTLYFEKRVQVEVYEPLGYQQITDLSSAVGLTVPDGARVCLIQSENQDVRWRDDGGTPTATVGMVLHPVHDGSVRVSEGMWYEGDLSSIRFIEKAAGAVLNVNYYR